MLAWEPMMMTIQRRYEWTHTNNNICWGHWNSDTDTFNAYLLSCWRLYSFQYQCFIVSVLCLKPIPLSFFLEVYFFLLPGWRKVAFCCGELLSLLSHPRLNCLRIILKLISVAVLVLFLIFSRGTKVALLGLKAVFKILLYFASHGLHARSRVLCGPWLVSDSSFFTFSVVKSCKRGLVNILFFLLLGMRLPHSPPHPILGSPVPHYHYVTQSRGGTHITREWKPDLFMIFFLCHWRFPLIYTSSHCPQWAVLAGIEVLVDIEYLQYW